MSYVIQSILTQLYPYQSLPGVSRRRNPMFSNLEPGRPPHLVSHDLPSGFHILFISICDVMQILCSNVVVLLSRSMKLST